MTWEEANIEMNRGMKIKRPLWPGYIYKNVLGGNYEDVLMLLGDGQTVPFQWADCYNEVEDFAITDGALGFDFAIRSIKAGRKVKRVSWHKDARLSLQDNVSHLAIGFYMIDELLNDYVGTNVDMLANDWVIVE